MKAVFSTSVACSAVSLLGLLGLSVATVAPATEDLRVTMMLLVGFLMVGWLRLALWARARLRSHATARVSQRLKTVVVVGGMLYILFILFCSLG